MHFVLRGIDHNLSPRKLLNEQVSLVEISDQDLQSLLPHLDIRALADDDTKEQ